MDNQDQIIIPAPVKDVAPIKDVNPSSSRYTKITGASCDCNTIKLLKALLGGRYGEFTGHSTYFYQSLISQALNSALASSLRGLSDAERNHMDLIGNAIIAFGGNPRFTNGQGTPWSSRMIDYTTDKNAFLTNNIRREERAIREYEKTITKVTNESLRQLFREIIADKRNHILILQGLLNR